jgi:hypothetical protein
MSVFAPFNLVLSPSRCSGRNASEAGKRNEAARTARPTENNPDQKGRSLWQLCAEPDTQTLTAGRDSEPIEENLSPPHEFLKAMSDTHMFQQ